MDTPSAQAVQRAINRIRYELVTIYEEGMAMQTPWYTIDRIAAIKVVCEQLLAGNELACVDGYANESATNAKDFDYPWDVPNGQDVPIFLHKDPAM